MAATKHAVRVFVCSLVSDTRGERAVLETDVFPQLRERLASHGYALEVVFSGLDTHCTDPLSGTVLANDFKAIDECRPFFIAILGERYGCPPDTIPTSLLREQRWILDYAERSILELEILHGVLNHPQTATGSFFFFREPRTVFAVPRSDRDSLLEDIPEFAERLANLKDRIQQSGRPVLDNYPCRWDADSRQMGELDVFAARVRSDLSAAIEAEHPELATCLVSTAVAPIPASATKTDKPNYVDEDVQFTVFRPKTVRPEQWYDLVAAAHLEEKRETAEEDEPEPLEKVRRKARNILGSQLADYKEATRDSTQSVPQGGEITFLFEMDQVEFNPARCTFQWLEDEHTVDVRMRASRELDGRTATGQMSVFLGAILLADVPLKIKVDSRFVSKEQTPESEPASARPYRKIFASYSHQDLIIVEQFERFAEALGDRYLRDWKDLRAGENWDSRLMQLIEEADVFQLFWSCHSMESQFVRREWEYALGLGRSNFVRPVYWEQPFPRRPDLPTTDLARLHFQHLTAGGSPHVPAASLVASMRPLGSQDPDEGALDLIDMFDSNFELPKDDEVIDLDDMDSGAEDATQLKADEDFQLAPSAMAGDEEDEDSGAQVIALEDSEAFADTASMLVDDEEDELVLGKTEDELEGALDDYQASPSIWPGEGRSPTVQMHSVRSSANDWLYILATAVIALSVLALLAWLFIFRPAKRPATPEMMDKSATMMNPPGSALPDPSDGSTPSPTGTTSSTPATAVQDEPPLASLTNISAAVGDTAAYGRELRAYLDRYPGSKRSADFQRILDEHLPLLDRLNQWRGMLDRWSTTDMRAVTPNQAASMLAEATPLVSDFIDLPQLEQVRERQPYLEAVASRLDARGQSIVEPLIARFQDPTFAAAAPSAVETLAKLEDQTWESTFYQVLQAVSKHEQSRPSQRVRAMHEVLEVAAQGSLPMRHGFSPHLAMLADFSQRSGTVVPGKPALDDTKYESRCSDVLAKLPDLTQAAQQAAIQYHSLQFFPRSVDLVWSGWLGRDDKGLWQHLTATPKQQVSPTSGPLVVFYRSAPAAPYSLIPVGKLTDATATIPSGRPEALIEGLPVLVHGSDVP
jgi:hypothetical protein